MILVGFRYNRSVFMNYKKKYMSYGLRNILDERYRVISDLVKKTEEKLARVPQGRLIIKHRNNSAYYYAYGESKNRKERLLSRKNPEEIEVLVQKSYLEMVLKAARKEKTVLENLVLKYPETVAEDIYNLLPEERRMFAKNIMITDDAFVKRWVNQPYKKKPISDDLPVYITKKGERVRSKSEMIIANMLYDYGIPYKYECPLLVGGEIFHPDFTILRLSDRQVVYYEHCGKMGDPGYVEDMIDRSRKYAFDGIFQGDRLFYTFESAKQPLDVRVITEMIENNFR